MGYDLHALPPDVLAFLAERHLATLTTLRPDGTPHVVPVGFTVEPRRSLARVITGGESRKARNLAGGGRAVLCSVDGRRWLTLEGSARVVRDAAAVREAERRYAERYRVPRPNPARVVLEISVDRVLGSVGPAPELAATPAREADGQAAPTERRSSTSTTRSSRSSTGSSA